MKIPEIRDSSTLLEVLKNVIRSHPGLPGGVIADAVEDKVTPWRAKRSGRKLVTDKLHELARTHHVDRTAEGLFYPGSQDEN